MLTRIRIIQEVKEFGLKTGDELNTPYSPGSLPPKGRGIFITDPQNPGEKVWLYSFEFEEIEPRPR